MGHDGDDLARFVRHYRFGGFDQSAARVGHVVDEDGDFVLDVADEDHAGDFVGARALFVDEGEAEVEAVGYGCCSGGWSALVLSRIKFLEIHSLPFQRSAGAEEEEGQGRIRVSGRVEGETTS